MTAPLNFYQSTTLIATSGQPTRQELYQIADDGYQVVINLAMHDSENALADEGSIVASLGMHYINIPVPFDEPEVDHLQEFIGFMEVLKDKKVWVHCAVNARVSAFMFQYLTLVKSMPSESATSPVLTKWRTKMDAVWKSFMEITRNDLDI